MCTRARLARTGLEELGSSKKIQIVHMTSRTPVLRTSFFASISPASATIDWCSSSGLSVVTPIPALRARVVNVVYLPSFRWTFRLAPVCALVTTCVATMAPQASDRCPRRQQQQQQSASVRFPRTFRVFGHKESLKCIRN